jgi:hypothetical protein
MLGSTLAALLIAAIAIAVVTAHFGTTSTAKLEAQEDVLKERLELREEILEARQKAREERLKN